MLIYVRALYNNVLLFPLVHNINTLETYKIVSNVLILSTSGNNKTLILTSFVDPKPLTSELNNPRHFINCGTFFRSVLKIAKIDY